MNDVMLDLETLGIGNDAVIIQVGACYFDRKTGDIGDTIQLNINAETSLKNGFSVTASTIQWWCEQSVEAIKSVFSEPKLDVHQAMVITNSFLKNAKQIWSHAAFDYVKLLCHFDKLGIKPNFHYRAPRDLRTLVDLAGIDVKRYEREGIKHNALDDCKYQVKYAVDCFNAVAYQII